jgi:hypothetical protein
MADLTIKVTADDVRSTIAGVQTFMATLPAPQQAVLGLLINGANVGVKVHSDVELFSMGASIGAGVAITDVTGGLAGLLGSVELTATEAGGLAIGLVDGAVRTAAGVTAGLGANIGAKAHVGVGGNHVGIQLAL